ncbi:hypothetical protein [Asticcacaulis sp. 201]|uniref:hypothetical protein n=1 Tax=Asticcacaulis sp. 201 TaxID=3028787 RepID=UPI002916D274|nr:hypothetical protein [Asticcacaulis sp. 201]MDV6331303.1 hypothetical protein [Asticcacaulis sp. 201]
MKRTHSRLTPAFVAAALLVSGVSLETSAVAQTTSLVEAVPSKWRLQNYIGGNVRVYFTGSTCDYGNITMPASSTAEELNRFYSTVMTAKATSKTMGIYYIYDGSSCFVTSFYLKEE